MKDPLRGVILLMIFSITLDYRFFSGVEGLPSITLAEGLSYLALVLFLGRLALERDEVGGRMAAVYGANRPVVWYFVWTGLASLVSLTRSTDALRYYKDLIPSLIAYFLVATFIDSHRAAKGVMMAFLCGTFLNLILGVSQVLSGGPLIVRMNEGASLKMNLYGEIVTGHLATGLFSHPNAYALFLVPAAILIAVLLFRSRSAGGATRLLLLALGLLIGYNLWNTYAKVVYVFISIGVALVFVLGSTRKWHLAIGLMALITTIVGITTYSLWAYLDRGRLFGTMMTRYELWKVALLAFRSDVFVTVFGNGFRNVSALSATYASMEYPNAHNAYLNQVIYYGLPALVLYIAMWSISLRHLADLLKTRTDWCKTAGLFLFSSLIALLGIYFFEPANQGVVAQGQFFVLLGLTSSIARVYPQASRASHEKDRHIQNGVPSTF